MVGWSRRGRESSERSRRFNEWYATLTPEEKAAYLVERAKEREESFALLKQLTLGFLFLFILAEFFLWVCR